MITTVKIDFNVREMKMKKFASMTAVVACCSIPAAYANMNLVQNGSFESQQNFGQVENFTASGLADWTIDSGSVDLVSGAASSFYWQAADGNNSLDLDGLTPGTISQSINTNAGQTYKLTFEYAGNPDLAASGYTNDPNKTMTMTVDVTLDSQVFTFTNDASTTKTNMGYKTGTLTFMANSASTLLTFASGDATTSAYGMVLDNIQVVAVPESETWAMLLVGLGLVGLRLRKKEHKQGQFLS